MKQIPASHMDLMKGSQRVCFATIRADGHPQLVPARCIPEGDDILLFIEPGSAAESNLRQNPMLSVLAYARGNPLHNMEIRGEVVEIVKDEDSLPQKMRGIGNTVCVRIAPTRIRVEG